MFLTQVQLKRALTRSLQLPVRVKVPHAVYGSRSPIETSVCIFCKTEDKEAVEQALTADRSLFVTTVISLGELKKSYKDYKSQKQLLKEHTHFICTASVQRQTYQVLGPHFGKRHLLPVVIRDNLNKMCDAIAKVLSSAYVHLSGDNMAIRLAHGKMSSQQVADNVISGAEFLAAKIPDGGWKNVHSIHLKTAYSPAIPVYSRNESELVNFLQSKVHAQAAPAPKANAIRQSSRPSSTKADNKSSKKAGIVKMVGAKRKSSA